MFIFTLKQTKVSPNRKNLEGEFFNNLGIKKFIIAPTHKILLFLIGNLNVFPKLMDT